MIIPVNYGFEKIDLEVPEDLSLEMVMPSTTTAPGSPEKDENFNKLEQDFINKFIYHDLMGVQEKIKKSKYILIASDDNTRVTPVAELIQPIRAVSSKLEKEIKIIVAGGSHRLMTRDEKVLKFGKDICEEVSIIDHEWSNPESFQSFGQTKFGYELKLNKIASDLDLFLIGIGNIVPHRVVGFSGGYKILLPGLSCSETIGKIHYLSAKYPSERILGLERNPIRDQINMVDKFRPINYLVNTVLDGNSNIISLCTGHPITAQYQGALLSKRIYGVHVGQPADMVISDSIPEIIDFWVCSKALTNTKSFVKKGGDLAVYLPCDEGLSPKHGKILMKYGYFAPPRIDEMVNDGTIDSCHLLEASHLAHVGEVLEHCQIHLISDGLASANLDEFGFHVVRVKESKEYIAHLFKKVKSRSSAQGRKPVVKVVRRGSEILPIL
ncbi:MAG: lactate racemase domain-containing protein [Promethearchaeota archaeon]